MTWNEFKELVDKELLRKGYDGDVGVWYIVIDTEDRRELIEVCLEVERGLFIIEK